MAKSNAESLDKLRRMQTHVSAALARMNQIKGEKLKEVEAEIIRLENEESALNRHLTSMRPALEAAIEAGEDLATTKTKETNAYYEVLVGLAKNRQAQAALRELMAQGQIGYSDLK